MLSFWTGSGGEFTVGAGIKPCQMQECNWVVSGDGEYVRHAITNEEGFQLARVWLEDGSSMGHWVPGSVNAEGSQQPGMLAAGLRRPDYQILTASESKICF